ncbi:MAG TPA: hypothetical protein VLL98_02390 [Rickettsiales bacterium]|nr:hypothetical protein [Rickettsiales bacterium]
MKLEECLIVFATKLEENGAFEEFYDRVIFTGVGKINSTYALTKKLAELKQLGKMPKYVINIGTVSSDKYKVGDIVYCNRFIQHDMDATKFGFELGITPEDQFPLLIEHKKLIEDLPNATCGTGDSFEPTGPIYKIVDVIEMEAYAFARVCKFENIDFIAIKSVTNRFDESPEDWVTQARKGSKLSFQYLKNKLFN